MQACKPLKQILERADRILLPAACAFCRTRLTDGETGACPPCLADLPRNDPACRTCGAPLPVDPGIVPCADCQAKPLPLAAVIAPLRYAFPVDIALQSIKYRRRLEYLPVFAEVLRAELGRLPPAIDGVVAVPLYWLRQGRRGFNQAAELARPLARALGLKPLTRVERVRRTQAQAGLDRTARRKNLRRAFAVRGRLDARHILLVDDVMTTGSTLVELAKCLREAGAQEVSAIVVARAIAGR